MVRARTRCTLYSAPCTPISHVLCALSHPSPPVSYFRCAHGRLLTVFSAPDYGARWKNDAAMLVINRELHVFPKVDPHPSTLHPPPLNPLTL